MDCKKVNFRLVGTETGSAYQMDNEETVKECFRFFSQTDIGKKLGNGRELKPGYILLPSQKSRELVFFWEDEELNRVCSQSMDFKDVWCRSEGCVEPAFLPTL